VNNLHGVRRVADGTWAFGGLGDLATVNVDLDGMITNRASEEGISHVGNDGGSSDDETFDSDNLVDIWKSLAQHEY
jgi:hypothetical protein